MHIRRKDGEQREEGGEKVGYGLHCADPHEGLRDPQFIPEAVPAFLCSQNASSMRIFTPSALLSSVLLYFRKKFLSEVFRGWNLTPPCCRRQDPEPGSVAMPRVHNRTRRGAGASPTMALTVIPVGLKNSCHLCGTSCSGIHLGINNPPFGTAPSWGMPQSVVQVVGFFACWRLFQNSTAQTVLDVEPGLVCGHLTSSVPLQNLLLNNSSLTGIIFPSIYRKQSMSFSLRQTEDVTFQNL